MGVNRRGVPSWQTAQQIIATGQIGRLRQITAVMMADLRIFREEMPFAQPVLQWLESSEIDRVFLSDIPKPGSWRNDPHQMGGDMFTDVGSHLVDVMLWMAGRASRRGLGLCAQGPSAGRSRPHCPGPPGKRRDPLDYFQR